MSFTRPSLTELRERILADLASRIPSSGGASATSLLRRSLVGALGLAEAGAVHSLYGYLVYIAKQAIPDTATDEYLLRWAAIWLRTGRKPATYAVGGVVVSGAVGAVLPLGTLFIRSDGTQYRSTQELTLSATTGTVPAQAVTPGSGGNAPAGVALNLLQPVVGFQSQAVVASSALTGGVDQESEAALRARMLSRIQNPPQGGAASDYLAWALEVPGVTRAWVAPREMGPGTVTVRIADDGKSDGYVPDATTVAAAQAYIAAQAPVTADVYVVAQVPYPVPMTINLSPNSATVRAAVQLELDDLFYREGIPGGTMLISKIREAISSAAGVNDSALVTPTANVVAPVGQLPIPGAITWGNL